MARRRENGNGRPKRSYDGGVRAVVVGGGIGGLGAAIALERAGVEPIVIERAPELREAGFGLVVSANAVTALRALGLHEGVAACGSRVRRAEIRNPRGDLLTLIDYEALGWETYGILRSDLQRAMLEAVSGDHLRLGTTCLGATDDGQTLLDGAKPMVGGRCSGRNRCATADIAHGAQGLASTTSAPATASSRSGASPAASASALPAAAASTGTASR